MIDQWAATLAKGTAAERQGGSDDDEAHRFVEDHCLQRCKPKCADQERQPKFRTA